MGDFIVVIATVSMVGLALISNLGLKDDIVVVLRRKLGQAVKSLARRSMSEAQANEFIDWFECDRDEILQEGGNGIGLTLRFLLVTGPRFALKARKSTIK